MAFCEKCGKKIEDGATLCPKCQDGQAPVTPAVPVKKKRRTALWIILGSVVLLIGIFAFLLFRPRNIKLNDIREVSTAGAVIHYGWPEDFKTDEYGDTYLNYGQKLEFYDITPQAFGVYPEEDKVVFFFSESDRAEVQRILSSRCSRKDSYIFNKYRYENLIITTDSNYWYVSIEID